jgi:hypothetical protein
MNNKQPVRLSSVSSRSLAGFALTIALVVLFATTAAVARTPQGSFEKTLTVSGPVDLEVLTHSGDVTVRTGASGVVLIRGKIYVSDHWNILPGVEIGGERSKGSVHDIEQNPPIRQEGNSVHIDYVNVRNIAIDYEITVPTETTIRSHSGSGDQTIEGTRGNVDVQTGSGDVRLNNLAGEIRLQTGSGNLRAREISGAIRGGTGSGDVEIEETGKGDIDLHTGSGNITTRGIQGGFRGETGSGDVTAEGTQTGAWQIRTGSGNVHLRLPANAAFDADINTSSGTIDVEMPLEMTVQGRVQESRKTIHGKVRGGGQLLSVRTGSGDIHIQ